MGNLGSYQLLTTVAKKCGGPVMMLATLTTLSLVAGCIIGMHACTKYLEYQTDYQNNDD